MELTIRGKGVEITDNILAHVTDKLEQLERHLPVTPLVTVELSSESMRTQRHRVVAQVTMNVNGSILRSEQCTPDVQAAINSAMGYYQPPHRAL